VLQAEGTVGAKTRGYYRARSLEELQEVPPGLGVHKRRLEKWQAVGLWGFLCHHLVTGTYSKPETGTKILGVIPDTSLSCPHLTRTIHCQGLSTLTSEQP